MTGESKASVLIVEDDPYLNLAIAETLRSYDFSVEQVYNGLEALQSVRARQPDVIVCDINMPVMDGYTFLQQTRADPELRLLPFIFLTARTTTEDQRRAKAIGVDRDWMRFILPKGFIAVDGSSLTIGKVGEDVFDVHLIPETLRLTKLGTKKVGEAVNIELDPKTVAIVQTVERVLAARGIAT